ncbi:TadE/TadG family type IV pilus assembly protein [Magnetovibrio sp. PR-2]|uniref:TadE/TadG family type IV pilus assembly protein n=1 Tax=Magnetovibrio sp. PR-2 TaxID=3120356 RepID=UPI002FCE3E26
MYVLSQLKKYVQDVRGAAAVEFALISPIVAIVILGVADFGFLTLKTTQVSSATRAGIQFVMTDPDDYAANITTVVTNSTNLDADNMTVTTSEGCRCLGSSTAVDCSADNCSGNTPPKYVTITTTYTHDMIMGYPGVDNPYTVTKSAVIRIPNS